ncbi:hypothetical protein LINPERPRIM_LOCUS40978, partial [Linum perenne]
FLLILTLVLEFYSPTTTTLLFGLLPHYRKDGKTDTEKNQELVEEDLVHKVEVVPEDGRRDEFSFQNNSAVGSLCFSSAYKPAATSHMTTTSTANVVDIIV